METSCPSFPPSGSSRGDANWSEPTFRCSPNTPPRAKSHGQVERSLQSLVKALAIDPLRDDLNYRYLDVLGRLGRRNQVIAHYQRYIRRLADELGLDPPETTQRLYEQIIS